MATAIHFGSHVYANSTYAQVCAVPVLKQRIPLQADVQHRIHHAMLLRVGQANITKYDTKCEAAWADLDAKLPKCDLTYLKPFTNSKGFTKMKRESAFKIKKMENRLLNLAREEEIFQHMDPICVTNISIGGGSKPSIMPDPVIKWFPKRPCKIQKKNKVPRITGSHVVDNLSAALINIARQRKLAIELVDGKRSVKGKYENTVKGTVFRVSTLHAEHKIRQRDMASSHFLNKVIAHIGNKSTRSRWQPSDLKPGTSGFVLKRENLNIRVGRCYDGTLVVRGLNCGVLLDARSKITRHVMNSMKHFSSDPAVAFWRGFSTTFQQMKPQDLNHQCESNFSVEACGKVAAIVCQSLFPCGRITCKQCASENEEQNLATLHTRLISVIKSSLTEVNEEFPEFTHVSNFLQLYCNLIDSHNGNFEAFSEVKKLIGHRQDAPFTHVLRVNEELIKGGLATSQDFAAATNATLEIARYLKNRTENIQKGSLTSFRNKVSQKSHLNLALMCDNQLDKNGNFIWGNRGFHAKRIFSNFFERVDMVKGYGHYENRLNPNGSRKIAIRRLIVSTNLATLRSQMKGEPVSRHPISKQCVSMLEGNFVYPCCCVTFDDGTPVESELRTPTKSHLVVGNAGDSKYVDLPDIEGGGLYIAKDGYCYTLLFLAMLVNVKEEEAKTFTKMVRDTIVPQLGQWPSMMDVATCCYMLTIFYPDTRGAELPRILVDHTHKVLHVIDSYGSISTGYHILKANTVNQLIQFASGELDSEIKNYIVGGTNLDHRPTLEQKSLKLLMKGIFNAEVMETIITEEPYILLLSVLSPGVLLALYNSGSLEKATKIWVRSGSDLLNIATTLSTLATRVSVATSLVDQVSIIDSQADHIFNISFNGYKTYYSYNLALQVLQRVRARTETDSVLQSLGFNRYDKRTLELVEKNYLEELNQEWHELSWYGKCCAIMESRKQRGNSIKCLVPTKTADMKGRYDISLQSLLAERYQKIKRFMCRKLSAIRERTSTVGGKVICGVVGYTRFLIPDFIRLINVLLVANLLIQLTMMCNSMLREHKRLKHIEKDSEANTVWKEMKVHYKTLSNKLGCAPTKEEFIEYLDEKNSKLCEQFLEQQSSLVAVQFQAKKQEHQHVEQIIAFVTLVLMLFDSERSDCVFKTLNKLKGTMASLDNVVVHQGIDDIKDLAVEKNLTVDFVLDKDSTPELEVGDTTFEQWWQNRIQCGATLCHYRTEGFFMEFTRATAAQVASQISHDAPNDILIRGAVGSGKSTGLPYYLSKKGKVLILEPTRPLAENVCKQLRASPFHVNPTLMMRGLTSFGSTPITVMTSGFALHYFANNVKLLAEYQFVIIDECHVLDSNAMAFCSLLHEYPGNRKLIKVSATPPGREVDFSTQHPVTIKIEESLSFQQFVSNQGTGVNSDVISTCDNILVYVASYSEVDTLSKMLVDKGHKVTKVDGRTMKVGNVEILTSGSKAKKHFIVATNIIENGVTIDIDAVVDFGLKVTPILDVDNRLIRYQKNSISYGERIQRLGRVGRHKPGLALRIGHTEKGLVEIPTLTAIEAAFLCFTYNLPVMTHNVTTNLLSQCTVRQARTMNQFELNPLYTNHFVRFDGTMHPQVFEILKIYRLRDSEVTLNKMAIPNKGISNWISVSEYRKFGVHIEADDETRIPFHLKEVPDKIHMQMWAVVNKFKGDAGFGRLTSIQVSKIAYTLQTDILAIPRTIKILDSLIASEQMKKAQFTALFNGNTDGFGFTLTSILSAIRRRHMHDYTEENICKMQNIRAQLLEFKNLNVDPTNLDIYKEFGCLESVYHQSENQMSKYLKLRGVWNKSLIAQDVIIAGGVLGGGIWMLASHFKRAFDAPVYHQAKRKVQKLKFRQARDNKMKREFYGDDSTMDEYFGSAYTKKGKSKGTAVGSGKKNRRFVNMYGFDPSDFSLVRFVDPLTGSVLDESPYTDIMLVQEHFGDIRSRLIDEDRLEKEAIVNKPGIEAYYIKDLTSKAIKVDLTPHNPFRLCDRTNNISGFPEREGELRQSSIAKFVDASEVPENKEAVQHEGKALFKGLRDYNPIATTICQLTNNSDGHTTTLFGIGYGALIITNQHLFRHNNGQLTIKSHHGEFVVKNTTQLQFLPCEKRDIVVFRMPKDFPPFSQKLVFRSPESGERVCLVGSNFQTKSITSTVSETCTIFPIENTFFWKHWITTKDGNCGLPIVSTKDGCILGLHSLATITQTQNYFAAFPADFSTKYLDNQVVSDWVRNWKYNINKISWGQLDLHKSVPVDPFKISKLVLDLGKVSVKEQGRNDSWFLQEIGGNIKAVGQCDSQLVTKHAIHGKCPLFQTYLSVNKEANNFFSPLMGAYQKSRLNKEAYIKDAMKYSGPIFIGDVNCNLFERAISATIVMMEGKGFPRCTYITDEVEIIGALNMKAAVGALYQGRKREYFTALTTTEQEETVKSSCLRLYKGLFGVWNGSLKAELRPMEKVELNKTRSFTAAPLDTLLAGKVCVDDFNNHFYQRNIKLPWTVGMTKFYGGWNELLKELPAGWVYCDADGSQFDSSLSPYLINAVLQIRLHFMEDWDIGEQMLRNLYTEIVYTAILSPDGTIVKKYKGNNSGQPSTVVDNTLMVVLAMKYALMSCGVEPCDQDDMCKFFANGDDLIIALKPEFEWCLDTFGNSFNQLGLTYDFSSRTTNKTDLWFMSHRGILVEGVYIPKLEQERIVSILEWDRSNQPEHRLEAICASMVESWGYPQLTHEIRLFYQWVLEQAPFNALSAEGKAPYIAESALHNLYMNKGVTQEELEYYSTLICAMDTEPECYSVYHQATTAETTGQMIDAGVAATIQVPRTTPEDTTTQQLAASIAAAIGSSGAQTSVVETQPHTQQDTQTREAIVSQRQWTPQTFGLPQEAGPIFTTPSPITTPSRTLARIHDRDVDVGTSGTFQVPRLNPLTSRLRIPMIGDRRVVNLDHLITYEPDQEDLANTRASHEQFRAWYEGVKGDYGVGDGDMQILLNGLMVWCIENGTSPNITGFWSMMDGMEQVRYPLKPILEHAQPTLRQIMAHFSDLAQAYIEKRNLKKKYMPRYGLVRNMTDYSLARYCFDFYEVNSQTPIRAREAHAQMKAAALRNAHTRMFGLDGNITTKEEDTERHTAEDVNRDLHHLMGVRGVV